MVSHEETSLRRFVDELTRDIQPDTEGAREARVQRVLDFVSRRSSTTCARPLTGSSC